MVRHTCCFCSEQELAVPTPPHVQFLRHLWVEWGTPYLASIMLITLTVADDRMDGVFCQCFFPPCQVLNKTQSTTPPHQCCTPSHSACLAQGREQEGRGGGQLLHLKL
jgi:hypothetical protein